MILFNAYSINLFVILPVLLVPAAIALFLSALIRRIRFCIYILKLRLEYPALYSDDHQILVDAIKKAHFIKHAIRLLFLLPVGATVAFYLGQYISENSPGYITIGLFIAYLIRLFIEVKKYSIYLGEDVGEMVGSRMNKRLSAKNINQ